jgi:acyl-CoA thioester hydrolase
MNAAPELPETRDRYAWFVDIPTRWMGVDVYGHVNNVEYYSYFDMAAAAHLIGHAGLDPHTSPVIGLFRQDDDEPAATGYFVHVYVDRESQKPASIPAERRVALEQLVMK